MNRTALFLATASILALHLVPGHAAGQETPRKPSVEESNFSVTPVLGWLRGSTLYHISYYEGPSGIESELEFPLRTPMMGLAVEFTSANYRYEREWKLQAKVLRNINDGSGFMKDSDWATDDVDIAEVGAPHPGLDIYSESDADLTAQTVELSFVYNIFRQQRVKVGPVVKYLYQKFEYDVFNTDQVGYGPYSAFTGYIPGPTLEYEVTYSMLAVGVNVEYPPFTPLRTHLQLAYAPMVSARDRDDHLLRYKLSEGSATGTAFLASLGLVWDIRDDIMLTAEGEYKRIRTTGTQDQSFYAGPFAGTSFSVDDRIDSDQLFFSLRCSFLF